MAPLPGACGLSPAPHGDRLWVVLRARMRSDLAQGQEHLYTESHASSR